MTYCDFVSWWDVVVEGGDVAADDVSGVDDCETDVTEGRGGVGEGEVFEREFVERRKGVCGDVRYERDCVWGEEIFK